MDKEIYKNEADEEKQLSSDEAISYSETEGLSGTSGEALPSSEDEVTMSAGVGTDESIYTEAVDLFSLIDSDTSENGEYETDGEPSDQVVSNALPSEVGAPEDIKEANGGAKEATEDITYSGEIAASSVKSDRKEKRAREIGSRGIDTIFDFLELFIFTLVGVLIATSFIFRHSVVSGPSMMNTLQNNDKLIISDLFYEPEYMDIVVVQDYSAGITDPIVKRVIATEGDRVRVTPKAIYVNGKPLKEDDYIYIDIPSYSYPIDIDAVHFKDNDTLVHVKGQYYEFTVPENEIFIMGDHRNDSRDSRYYGTVREDSVLGKVILRFYPNFTFFND